MSDHPADLTRERTRAFTALALGLIGALGGGALAAGLQWFYVSVSNGGEYLQDVVGLVNVGFGVAAVWLATDVGSSDPVAVPAARAAKVLGAVAVLGGALMLLAALTDQL